MATRRRADTRGALGPSLCAFLLAGTLSVQGSVAATTSAAAPTHHYRSLSGPKLDDESVLSSSPWTSINRSTVGHRWGLLPRCRLRSISSRGETRNCPTYQTRVLEMLRGGAVVDDETTDYDSDSTESDDEESEVDGEIFSDSEEDEDEYDEYDEYDDEDEGDEGTSVEETELDGATEAVVEYDVPYAPSFVQQMGSSVGVMVLSRKIDLFDPKVVRMVRIAFISYAVITQVFLAYVRIKAKLQNDRTPVTIKNPVSSLLQKQMSQGGGGNDMVKNIASQFLSSQSSVMEYDLKEAKKMGNSLLFPLVILWFMHFKMGQVQPLLFQISSGVMNVVYSPLFQIYVLGRNLERPFKSPRNPMAERMEALQKQQEEAAKAGEQDVTDGSHGEHIGGEDDAAGESADGGEVEECSDEYDDEESEEESDEEDESSDYDSDVDE